jgi:hypothetical protein
LTTEKASYAYHIKSSSAHTPCKSKVLFSWSTVIQTLKNSHAVFYLLHNFYSYTSECWTPLPTPLPAKATQVQLLRSVTEQTILTTAQGKYMKQIQAVEINRRICKHLWTFKQFGRMDNSHGPIIILITKDLQIYGYNKTSLTHLTNCT